MLQYFFFFYGTILPKCFSHSNKCVYKTAWCGFTFISQLQRYGESVFSIFWIISLKSSGCFFLLISVVSAYHYKVFCLFMNSFHWLHLQLQVLGSLETGVHWDLRSGMRTWGACFCFFGNDKCKLMTNILQDFCDRGKSRRRGGILTFRVLSGCFWVTLLSFADKSLATRCILILVFSSKLCTAFLVHSFPQKLILSSLTFPLPFLPDICPGFFRESLLPFLIIALLCESEPCTCGFLIQSVFLPIMLSSSISP